jgi:hypothetical protein
MDSGRSPSNCSIPPPAVWEATPAYHSSVHCSLTAVAAANWVADLNTLVIASWLLSPVPLENGIKKGGHCVAVPPEEI